VGSDSKLRSDIMQWLHASVGGRD